MSMRIAITASSCIGLLALPQTVQAADAKSEVQLIERGVDLRRISFRPLGQLVGSSTAAVAKKRTQVG